MWDSIGPGKRHLAPLYILFVLKARYRILAKKSAFN